MTKPREHGSAIALWRDGPDDLTAMLPAANGELRLKVSRGRQAAVELLVYEEIDGKVGSDIYVVELDRAQALEMAAALIRRVARDTDLS